MIIPQLQMIDIVDIIIFFALEYLAYLLFFFIQRIDPGKGVTPSLFVLCFGINLLALSFLFRVGKEVSNQLVTFSILGGSIDILFGGVFVYYRKSVQMADLKKRHEEVSAIIKNLKEKYYKQEISEEDLKSVNASLMRELAEIEVKLEGQDNKILEEGTNVDNQKKKSAKSTLK
jgi:uncharacterized membrane protein